MKLSLSFGRSFSTWMSYLRRTGVLTSALLRREVELRYRGSFLGALWAIVTPLLLLLVYLFVFGQVFESKWPGVSAGGPSFALVLFIGLCAFTIFAESVAKAPTLITGNPNYVKKVIFPLEVLAVVNVLAATVQGLLMVIVWVIVYAFVYGDMPWALVVIPLLFAPVILWALGLSWILSVVGVYFRDVAHAVQVLVTVLFFASPIFYPLEAVPVMYREILELSPLAIAIEGARAVLLGVGTISWLEQTLNLVVALVFAAASGWFFMLNREALADGL